MIRIACPHCGERAQAEFTFERPVDSVVSLDDQPDEAMKKLYTRTNPRGPDEEIWRHSHGCGGWLKIRRDRVSHRVEWIRPMAPKVLP